MSTPNSLASKLAANSKVSPEDKVAQELEEAAKAPANLAPAAPAEDNVPEENTIKVGATGVGENFAHARNAQGRFSLQTRAPGYYSILIGRINLGKRRIDWPPHTPLVPEEDDEELIKYLQHQVKNNRAIYVAPEEIEESTKD